MAPPAFLRSELELIAFDVYDTLLDRRSVLTPAIADLLDPTRTDLDPPVFLRRYLAQHFRDSLIDSLLPTPHTPFKELTRRALTYRLTQADIPVDAEDILGFVDQWNHLPAYSDTATPLETLAREYQLVGLSNGDPDMLSAVMGEVNGSLHALHSVALAENYKPHPAPYRWLTNHYQLAPHQVLFVTAHTFDLLGAKATGMYGCYYNRHDTPYGEWPIQPDLHVTTLDELANTLVPTD